MITFPRLFGGEPKKLERIALVCANFGGIDGIKSLPHHADVDGFYYSDQIAEAVQARSYKTTIQPDYPRFDFNNRLRGRYFKHQIHRLPEVQNYRWFAWADANVQFHDTLFLAKAASRLARQPPHRRLLLIPHPDRATITEEFRFISDQMADGNKYLRLRYLNEKMPEQMAYFARQNWNLGAPLWCGTVWLVENSELMARAWDAWWDQNLRFGMMDQLSLPVILDQHNIKPHAADFSLVDNPHFTWGAHQKLC